MLARKALILSMALALMAACRQGHRQMTASLEELERMNSADSLMTNDSLALALCDYFDSHGTPNERMRAHYILGRTYADLGDSPLALEEYLTAAMQADTSSTETNFSKLSRVYGQMSNIFYIQNLMNEYIEKQNLSVHFANKAKDTLQALNGDALIISAYLRMQRHSIVVSRFDSVFRKLRTYYGDSVAARYCTLPIESLLELKDSKKAKEYLDLYASKSGYFDSLGNIARGREVYYYYQGLYFLQTQKYDSAEICFRKELDNGLDFNNQNAASRGLALLYSKTDEPDSAAKYALYSYGMLDSVYASMATQEVERAKAQFNYNRHKAEALSEKKKADKERHKATILSVVILVLLILAYCTFVIIRKRRIAEKIKYEAKKKELDALQEELDNTRKQEEEHRRQINRLEDAIKQREKDDEELLRQNCKLEGLIGQIVREREEDTLRLKEELGQLKDKVCILSKQKQEQETYVSLLRTYINKEQQKEKILLEEVETNLKESGVYIRIKGKVKSSSVLTEQDFAYIENVIEKTLPLLHQTLYSDIHHLNKTERKVCMLLRLHYTTKEVANLLGVTSSSVSQSSESALFKIFKEHGSSKLLRKKLEKTAK